MRVPQINDMAVTMTLTIPGLFTVQQDVSRYPLNSSGIPVASTPEDVRESLVYAKPGPCDKGEAVGHQGQITGRAGVIIELKSRNHACKAIRDRVLTCLINPPADSSED